MFIYSLKINKFNLKCPKNYFEGNLFFLLLNLTTPHLPIIFNTVISRQSLIIIFLSCRLLLLGLDLLVHLLLGHHSHRI